MTCWQIDPSGVDTFAVRTHGGAVSRAAFFTALGTDAALRAALTEVLRTSPYRAFAWELPAFSATTAERPAELAIVDNPALLRFAADPSPFGDKFGRARVTTFANLGGDAILVVPSPHAITGVAHLAAFVRTAPTDLIDELWCALAHAVAARRAAKATPVWVSTAGLGVSWLHVRLDDSPKYYRHHAYTDPAA